MNLNWTSFLDRLRLPIALLSVAVAASAAVGSANASETDDKKDEAVKAEEKTPRANRLIHSTSPYLLQHAYNPVDWYEWGPEALEKAKAEDKPIFLSIGYSACHWCHVMEHESFENEKIAAMMNERFVCIKVDREERPDIDEIYMHATVGMNGSGGWPMSVFCAYDGTPFFAATYYPPDQFEQVLVSISDGWRDNREQVLAQASKINAYLQAWAVGLPVKEQLIPVTMILETATQAAEYFDDQSGGLASANGNKFPPNMLMELMLRAHRRSGEKKLLESVELTLTKMARGGIYDHLGDGICRYSTDPEWLVPHFEKMLYDQALVGSIYLDAYQVTRNPLFAQTARGICDYVLRDLQSPQGGFYSTRDADSEGMEGKYYIWTVEQVTEVLGTDDAELFCSYYDVTETGNWVETRGHAPKGPKNILNIQKDDDTFAKLHKLDVADWKRRLGAMKSRMLEARDRRVAPGLDDKILTGWNGLMIATLAKASQVLDQPRYAEAASKATDFILTNLRRDGKLLRSYRAGKARLTGYLSDYAFFTEGLLNLYESTFEVRHLDEAVQLTDDLIKRYYDEAKGAFFYTASDAEKLVARTKNVTDGAIPAANSVAATNLMRLAILTGNREYRAKAESIFRSFAPQLEKSVWQSERLLCAVDFYYDKPQEIVIVGSPSDPQTQKMIRAVHGAYRPNKVLVVLTAETASPALAERIPLLKGKRRIDGKTTAYVCESYTCKKPVTSVAALLEQLTAGH